MALSVTFKLARDEVVDFAKLHPVAVLSEFNLDSKAFATPKPSDRYTIKKDRQACCGRS